MNERTGHHRRIGLFTALCVGVLFTVAFSTSVHAADIDNDGVPDWVDSCPAAYNPTQLDRDGDGFGDGCDNCPESSLSAPNGPDFELDGVGDACDNCPFLPNSDQADADTDGVGDACDNCPRAANSDQLDGDADGNGDACDTLPGLPDPPVPFLVAPGKTSALTGNVTGGPIPDRIVVQPVLTCSVDNGYPSRSCGSAAAQSECALVLGTCLPAVFLASAELGEREDILQASFEWSTNGIFWNPIAIDTNPGTVGPLPSDLPDLPDEKNNPFAHTGWGVYWYSPPTDVHVLVRTSMTAFTGAVGSEIRGLWIDNTPPVPRFDNVAPHQAVSGIFTVLLSSTDEDVTTFAVEVRPATEEEKKKDFKQDGLGSEEQRKVGPNADNGGNNFCGPTAAKNALHRLAEADTGIYPNNQPDKNLQMAKKLADKMKTGKATGTSFDNLVEGLRDYLKERNRGCDVDDGYTVTSYKTEYKKNGTGGWAPSSTKVTWEDYEKEMRDGEAVTLLLLPWDPGADGNYGTGDDSVGYGHFVTGKDGEKDKNGAGKNEFSYVDPDTGKDGNTTWENRGGYPSVTYNGKVWIVHGFVAVSPKQKDSTAVGTVSGSGCAPGTCGSVPFDTRVYEDGYYLLVARTIDAQGNAGKASVTILVDNTPAACFAPPDLDGDTIQNSCDACVDAYDPTNTDSDADGLGDACDLCSASPVICGDGDADRVGDCCDNCPARANTAQADVDGDGAGDVCDNCPYVANASQTDSDLDGLGDACDDLPGVPDPYVAVLTSPAKTDRLVGRDPMDPLLPDRRLVEPVRRCSTINGVLDDLCVDAASDLACANAGGVCRDWVLLQAVEGSDRGSQVTQVSFAWSSDGFNYFPIGSDTVPNGPDGIFEDFPDVPNEVNAPDGSFGWEVDWFDPPLDVPLRIKVTVAGISPGGPMFTDRFFDVFVELTPPVPTDLLAPLAKVQGIVSIPVFCADGDIVRFDLAVKEDEAKNRPKKFKQEGLGSEKQGDVGKNGTNKNNNFCGPTAAKNALHRLAEKDKRIYVDPTKKTKNLDMAKALAGKMKTDADKGTNWDKFVGGIRDYLDKEKVGCTQADGYTVTEYKNDLVVDDNGTPNNKADDKLRPKKANFTWDDYEREMRNGEAVTLLILPWEKGPDGKYGTADDSVGYGHYITGEDGKAAAKAGDDNDFSYVDPADGKAKNSKWRKTADGGYPQIDYNNTKWFVYGFVAVSPKKRADEKPADTKPAGGGAATMQLDTRGLEDGLYVITIYGIDAQGNAAKTTQVVEVDNHFDVCPGGPNQPDLDEDGYKDACDNCPSIPNFGQEDLDGDLAGDLCDNCPLVANGTQADTDHDAIGDACDCTSIFSSTVFVEPPKLTPVVRWLGGGQSDVIKGNLALLRANLGFTGSVTNCLANNTNFQSVNDGVPTTGLSYYLVREAVGTCGTGSFTTGHPKETGSAQTPPIRDVQIDAQAATCP